MVEVEVEVTREADGTWSIQHDPVADVGAAYTRVSLTMLKLMVEEFNKQRLGLERST